MKKLLERLLSLSLLLTLGTPIFVGAMEIDIPKAPAEIVDEQFDIYKIVHKEGDTRIPAASYAELGYENPDQDIHFEFWYKGDPQNFPLYVQVGSTDKLSDTWIKLNVGDRLFSTRQITQLCYSFSDDHSDAQCFEFKKNYKVFVRVDEKKLARQTGALFVGDKRVSGGGVLSGISKTTGLFRGSVLKTESGLSMRNNIENKDIVVAILQSSSPDSSQQPSIEERLKNLETYYGVPPKIFFELLPLSLFKDIQQKYGVKLKIDKTPFPGQFTPIYQTQFDDTYTEKLINHFTNLVADKDKITDYITSRLTPKQYEENQFVIEGYTNQILDYLLSKIYPLAYLAQKITDINVSPGGKYFYVKAYGENRHIEPASIKILSLDTLKDKSKQDSRVIRLGTSSEPSPLYLKYLGDNIKSVNFSDNDTYIDITRHDGTKETFNLNTQTKTEEDKPIVQPYKEALNKALGNAIQQDLERFFPSGEKPNNKQKEFFNSFKEKQQAGEKIVEFSAKHKEIFTSLPLMLQKIIGPFVDFHD